MKKHLTAIAGAIAVMGIAAAPAAAAPAQHSVEVEEYDAYEHLAADENFCGAWAATFHEVRSGQVKLVAAPGGREDGEYHVNGTIHGLVELIPDDASRPTYAGTYREKINGVVVGFDEDGFEILRVGQYRLRSTLRGTDGSQLALSLAGKTTMNADGAVVVSHDSFSCE
jgi:hypothetical protein